MMISALLLCLLTAPAAAQTPPDGASLKRLSLEELGNIVITSVSKEPEAVWNTAAAIYVLTQQDIQRSGATSIADALRLVPGVEVARIDTSRNWVVGVRGFGDQFSKSVLVLIDGRTAYTPLWAGVHWPIQDTLLEDIDRIEVIRGPGGTIWGANAENGVINIITKSAGETRGAYVSAASGNVDHAIAGVRFGGGSSTLQYRAYAKGLTRGPQFHRDDRNFDTWDMGQTGFRVDWQHDRDQVTVTGDAYRAETGESVRVTTFAPPATFLVDDPVDLNGANVLARWTRSSAGGANLTVQTYVDHTYRLGTDFGERRTTFDVDAVHRSRPWARHELTWGLGARTSPSELIQTYSFSDFQPHDATLNLFSAFAQDALTLVRRRLTLTGGVKIERNSYTGLETQPSARLLWTPSTRQTLWGAITRAVRIPSRVDEDITVILPTSTPLLYGVLQGNRHLKTERVIGAEIGYRASFTAATYVDVTAFHNDYDNLVDIGIGARRTQTTEGLTYTAIPLPWVNGNNGTTQGFEIAPDWQPSSYVRLRGSYSFVHIDVTPTPENVFKNTLPLLAGGTPSHQVTLQSLVTLPRRIEVDPVYRYVSAREGTHIPSYHTADLHIGVPLGAGLTLSVVGQSLLQPHHPEWARDPGPTVEIRRSAYVRIAWRH